MPKKNPSIEQLNVLNIRTKEDSISCLKDLENYKASLFKKNSSSINLDKYGIVVDSSADISSQLDSYIKKIKAFSTITVTSAVLLEDSFKETLYTWFKGFGLKDFLLDFSIDPNIYGGLLIEYNGNYYDLSLRKKVSSYVQHR